MVMHLPRGKILLVPRDMGQKRLQAEMEKVYILFPNSTEFMPRTDGKEAAAKEAPASHPPAKRYRMTDSMKNIVWELVLLSNECCRLENEKK